MTEFVRPNITLLAQLSSQSIDALKKTGANIKYNAGQTIHLRGDMKPGLSIVLEGRVRVGTQTPDGTPLTLTEFGYGHSFGEITSFIDLPRTHDVTAIEDSRILQLTAADNQYLIETLPDYAPAMLKMLSARLFLTLETVEDFRQKTPLQRLAGLLVTSQHGGSVSALQTDLAYTIGVSRVTIGKLLKILERKSLIQRGYGQIEILDPSGLLKV
ncbi:MAG: Crp/Fnr family transcriptional regulator [Henriciella sp.]|nr:Crp/Fnr family transcriptional regulator [Henriciella sp.]